MSKERSSNTSKKSVLAALAYICFVIPLLTKSRDDGFVRYHIKQGVGFFITAMALRGIIAAIAGPPYTVLGGMLSGLLLQPVNLVLIILFVFGVMNVFRGEMKPLPVIGKYAEKMF